MGNLEEGHRTAGQGRASHGPAPCGKRAEVVWSLAAKRGGGACAGCSKTAGIAVSKTSSGLPKWSCRKGARKIPVPARISHLDRCKWGQ